MQSPKEQIVNELLVMDAQGGDAKAMEKLVSFWQKPLWQHAFRLTDDSQAAWDVTQQTWLAIIKGLNKLHDPAKFKAWAYRITTNKSINWIKKREASKYVSIEQLGDHQQKECEEYGVKELLEKLGIKKKTILCLYYLEQLSIYEISIALNIPQGTVKSRLFNARQELKQLWDKYFDN
ncbi:MAG: sigma-70 family RNA polymerase sigma factor [Sedimentisphaerales bacterium]|nr:sigma-70 family RNA polymerase sigma factor [Sedimentisphaerales bacterium]